MVNPDENYQVSFDEDSYSLSSSSAYLKAKLRRVDGEPLTAEERQGWVVVDNSGFLTQSGNATVTATGNMTFTMKRSNLISLDRGESVVKLMKDGAVYATMTVNYIPSATIMTDSVDKLLTDGTEQITTLKINGQTVDINDYTITSVDTSKATVVISDTNISIIPLQEGQASFKVTEKNNSSKYAEAKIIFYTPSAKIGDVYYKTLANAFKAANSGDTIVLNNDTTESIWFSGVAPRTQDFELTFDLNGHKLTGTSNSSYTLRVDYGVVTVKDSVGTGEIVYGKDYAFLVGHLAGDYPSKLVIESGKFTGKTSVLQAGQPGGSGSNYKYYGGDVVIKGGTFNTVPDVNETYDSEGNFKYSLNLLDMNESNYAGGIYSPSSISVEGGRFYKFNPANNLAEGANTSFLAEGFKSEKNNDWYVVVLE